MMRLTKKLGLISSALVFMGLSSFSFAQTGAGVDIQNSAVLNFDVGGAAQDDIVSSPTGNSDPTLNAGDVGAEFTEFTVDRLLDLTVTTVDTVAVPVAPNGNNGTDETNSVALEFTVVNSGNADQNIALQAVNTAEPTLPTLTSGSADDFDPVATTFLYYVDTNTSGVLDAGDTEILTGASPTNSTATVPVLEDQAPGTTVTIFVVAQIPTNATVGASDVAAISLVAAVAEPTTDDVVAGNLGTAGNLILTDDAAAADTAGIDDVLGDGAAGEAGVDGSFDFGVATLNLNDGDDTTSNGQASDTSAYIIATADISVSKTVTTVCDNTSLATTPNAIPGSVQRYTITVTNGAAAGDSATLTTLDDIIPTNTALTVMRDYAGVSGDGTCAGFPALDGADNEFRAGCTDAAGTGDAGRGAIDCADASAGTYNYFAQAASNAIDSNGTAAGDTITVCYDSQSATGTGNDCTAAGSVVLGGDGGTTYDEGELAPDEAVIIEFDVIVQ